MGYLNDVKRQSAIGEWWAKKNLLLRQMASRGYNSRMIDGFRYEPKLLTIDEYRKWWYRSKHKLKDPITGEVEPFDETKPYMYQNGKPRVYNVVVMWSGKSYVLNPPVKALPAYPDLES